MYGKAYHSNIPIPETNFCLKVILLWRDTMTKTTLMRKIFNWGWLTGSEGWPLSSRQGLGIVHVGMFQEELRVQHLLLSIHIFKEIITEIFQTWKSTLEINLEASQEIENSSTSRTRYKTPGNIPKKCSTTPSKHVLYCVPSSFFS